MAVPNKKGCWYFTDVTVCPICGSTTTERIRRSGPKPKDPRERYSYDEVYDYCNV